MRQGTAKLAVQLVDPQGEPLERQSLGMMPLTEGYSDAPGRSPFWADLAGEVVIDSPAPGKHRFVINQAWPMPTFLEFLVPPDGLETRATVAPRDFPIARPDLSVDVAVRIDNGTLLDVTLSNKLTARIRSAQATFC